MNKKINVEFFGNSEPSLLDLYNVVRYEDKDSGVEKVIVTDDSLIGVFVYGGKIGFCLRKNIPCVVEEKPLKDILKELPDDAEIVKTYGGSRFEKFIQSKNLKTIKDLKKALGEE